MKIYGTLSEGYIKQKIKFLMGNGESPFEWLYEVLDNVCLSKTTKQYANFMIAYLKSQGVKEGHY